MDKILVEVIDGTQNGAVELRAQDLATMVSYLKNVAAFPNIQRTADYLKISNNSGTSYKYYFATNSLISC